MTLELVKPAPAPVKPAKKQKDKKTDLSYQDALDAIQAYDAAIQAAAKNRVYEVVNAGDKASNASARKSMFGSAASVILSIVGGSTGIVGHDVAGVFATTAFAALVATPILWLNPTLGRIVSPLAYRKFKNQQSLEEPLAALKEEEFAKVQAKILKKAKPAIAVINSHLKYDNRCVKYTNEKTVEGFSIVVADSLNPWEIEKLKFEKTTNLVALPSLDKKSITA